MGTVMQRAGWPGAGLVIAGLAGTMAAPTSDRIPLGPGDHRLSVRVGERDRRYLVHVPPGYDGRRPVPVVLMFHGAGGTARWSMNETGWGDKADRKGFLAVFPEGTSPDPTQPARFLKNPQLWNDGSGRTPLARLGVDDVAFTRALIEDLKQGFAVDDHRIYVTGFSNGAGLTFTLAVRLSNLIAAAAPVASHCWLKDPRPERAVPTLYIVGTQDPLIPMQGGTVETPWGRGTGRPPVQATIDRWAAALGCPLQPHVRFDRGGVKLVAYGPGRDGSEFLVYTVEGLGHHWPGGKGMLTDRLAGKPSNKLRATDIIWDFFASHPRP